ncbi:MAG TPA: hypothetical protein VFF06_31775 [Polyangia bacterium]|nr:hypothetical protein [Polyangia bacterium]
MNHRPLAPSLVIAALAAGCGSGAPAQQQNASLFGEVHVHGFPGGAHPGALFIARGVPASQADGDSLFPTVPARSDGACKLTLSTDPRDAPWPPLVGAGNVRISGGGQVPELELVFDASTSTYRPSPPLPAGRGIFDGGELLTITAPGGDAPGFSGTIAAPMPIAVTSGLEPPDGADVIVTWVPDHAERIDAALLASTSDGRWAMVECTAPDEGGSLTMPASLLAAMPAPPRDLELDVSRDRLGVARAQSGAGVLVHAGYEVALKAHQD